MKETPITNVIEIKNVHKSFQKPNGQELPVLKNIDFNMAPNQIIALLGKSGSGKSTLLRIVSGLLPPSEGKVFYRSQEVNGPVNGISMVFQNFALMPWLTVLQNVELGLEALGISPAERRSRAINAIDTIGLDGFESAYPKELSGGMRQRVGFARALVVEPDVLLMDEPFSSLDVLTSENLRGDLIDLWQTKKTRLSSILCVTHNIEEAVQIADRIIIFGTNPGHIRADLNVNIAHPRNDKDPAYSALIDKIYTLMTSRETEQGLKLDPKTSHKKITASYRLPDANISELLGLIETLGSPEYQGRVDLPELSEFVHLEVDDLFPIIEVLEILQLVKVSAGDVELTNTGKLLADADILERKKIFSTQLIQFVPLAKHIRQTLDKSPRHRALEERFLDELELVLSDKEAERVLKIVIDWARYAEIFAYDVNTGMLSLENPK
jgi:NitT/TauT family transport system ATP-binding protein